MSDSSQGEGWWIAADGKWYPPESHPDAQAAAPPAYEPPPQPSYQQPASPGMPPPPSQPPLDVMKPKRPWWKIALVVVGLGILLIGGCTVLVLRLASGPIDTSNDFLALIKAEDFNGAAAMLEPSCFGDGGSPSSLAELFSNGVDSYNLTGTSVNSNNGRSTGAASGTITFTGNDERSINFDLTKNDEWRVCGIQVGTRGG